MTTLNSNYIRKGVSYKIVQKQNEHAVYASGFYSFGRAQDWINNYDPNMWMDKSIEAKDLTIKEEVQS